jgi:MFS transporter, DHA1 family, multidrug resistance protein
MTEKPLESIHRDVDRTTGTVRTKPPSDDLPPTGQGGQLLATILIASFATSPLTIARLILPLIALGMGASTMFVGVMGSLFTVAPMLSSVRFGRWVDRTGTLVPILCSCSLILLGSVLFLLVPVHQTLLAVACLVGAGAMLSHVASTRAVSEVGETTDRARNLGYLVSSYSLFQFFGPILAGAAYDHAGPGMAVMTIGLFAACSLVGIASRMHNYRGNAAPPREAGTRGGAIDLLRLQTLRRWLLINSVFSAVQTFVPFVVSLHAVEIGISPTMAGMVLGAFSLGTVVSRISVPVLTRRLSAPVILFSALIVGAATYAMLPYMHHFHPLLGVSTVLGMAIGLGVPISLALIYAAAPADRMNESVGLSMALTNFLQTISPLALGLAVTGMGLAPMIWILALGMVGASIMAVRGTGE